MSEPEATMTRSDLATDARRSLAGLALAAGLLVRSRR